MTSKDLNPAEFWRYSLETYANQAVKDICLELQEDFCADVNLLLLSLWLSELDLTVNVAGFSELMALSSRWQQTTLNPLRKERRILKNGGKPYKLALEKELAAEKDEQAALVACANRHLANTQPASKSINGLLDQYAAALQLPHQSLLDIQAYVQKLP